MPGALGGPIPGPGMGLGRGPGGSLSFFGFSRLLVVFLGIPAQFPTLPGLLFCVLVAVFLSTKTSP